jgi:hypothetical protein
MLIRLAQRWTQQLIGVLRRPGILVEGKDHEFSFFVGQIDRHTFRVRHQSPYSLIYRDRIRGESLPAGIQLGQRVTTRRASGWRSVGGEGTAGKY